MQMQPQSPPEPEFKALGKSVGAGDGRLEAIPINRGVLGAHIRSLRFTCDEVTARCPVTGQPDQYVVYIELSAAYNSIESKSLKLYLQKFRDEGIFCEALAQQICDEVVQVALPKKCFVSVTQKSRGGISLEAQAAWFMDPHVASKAVHLESKSVSPLKS